MSLYKRKMNPFTGKFDYVIKGNIISFKEGVATSGDLPSTGNLEGEARIASDTHHLYVWDGSTWQDQGDVFDIKWATLEDKPASTVVNIDDAVSKRHTQNTDTKLDNGQVNEVTSADLRTHLDSVANPHTVTVDQLDLASGTVASDVDDAVSKKHTQGTDTTLGAMAADINMNSYQLGSLSVPDANGEAIRQTAKITEVSLEDAVDKKHTQNTDTALGTQSEDLDMGTHKIVNLVDPVNPQDAATRKFVEDAVGVENLFDYVSPDTIVPHIANSNIDIGSGDFITTGKISDGTNESTPAEIKDAVDKKHSQNTDIALRTNKLTVDANGHTTIVGELKIKLYSQDTEPTLNANDFMAIWKDTNDSNRIYLIFRRGSADQVSVELA